MKKITIIISLLLTTIIVTDITGQELTQVVRGTLVDKDSKMGLFGASLVIAGSNPQKGTITDENGDFNFGQLPVGRYDIIIYYMGYETRTLSNILVGTGKEVVLRVELTESVVNLEEVVVKGKEHKSETLNEMSTVSARTFTVEETRRYAGSFNDPGRMASSFAGVTGDPSGNNEIIVRGNSPRGMLWRLEEIEIPNPNHFAEEGSTGGPISILNGATLDNSDFFTGAFPAEYGNAYSGVFDIGLRNGNNQNREHAIQVGMLGTDITTEGPFIKGNSSSYLLNYRYSTLAMLNAIGIEIAGDAVPEFQDLTFKVNVPTQRYGVFTLFGIGGISLVKEKDDTFSNDFRTDMGAFGLKNTYFINEKTHLKSYMAYTGSKNIWNYKKPDETNTFQTHATEDFIYQTVKGSVNLNHKFNARNLIKAGMIYNSLRYDLQSTTYDNELQRLLTDVEQTGTTGLLQSYANWKHRLNEKLTVIGGLHSMYFALNSNYTIEPRLGIKYQFNPKQSINFGFGIHSKMETLSTYFSVQEQEDGSYIQPNLQLDFTKAQHYVIGYENLLSQNLMLRVEMYYQQLFNIPVEDSTNSSFSAVNYSYGYTNRSLTNSGTGRNIGIDITLEKYFSNNYYFMFTTSLYDSKYKAGDVVLRDTRYNGNYVFNVLGGKDFILGNEKKRTLSINAKGTLAGGQRTTPIDISQSEVEGYTIRNEELAFSEQWDDYFRFDLKISLTRNKKKASHTIELDIQNITNRLNVVGDYYDDETGQVETFTQLGLLPVFNYRIEF
ncbi:MAG: TonB-dependent receptor [Bacteroidales bacterium]